MYISYIDLCLQFMDRISHDFTVLSFLDVSFHLHLRITGLHQPRERPLVPSVAQATAPALVDIKKNKKKRHNASQRRTIQKNMVEQCLNMYGLFQKRLNINYLYRLWVQEYRYKALTRHINLFLLSWQRTPVHLQMNSTEKRTSCPSPCEQGECQKLIDQRLHCITWSSSCCCCGCSVGLIYYSWLVVYPPL